MQKAVNQVQVEGTASSENGHQRMPTQLQKASVSSNWKGRLHVIIQEQLMFREGMCNTTCMK